MVTKFDVTHHGEHDPVINTTTKEVVVLVTGYGPFLDKFPINSSWSIASTLPRYISPTVSFPTPIRIIVPDQPLRVSYAHVASIDPKLISGQCPVSGSTLWNANQAPLGEAGAIIPNHLPKPDLILHIGLAAGRNYFTFERQSRKGPYNKNKDVDGQTLSDAVAKELFGDCPTILKPTFDADDVMKRWRTLITDKAADIRPSDDPGAYLCAFVYYLSMSWFWKRNREAEARLVREKENEVDSNKIRERPVVFLHVPNLPTEILVEQGRQAAIGLIKAMVESRQQVGVVEPLRPSDRNDRHDDGLPAGGGWDGVQDSSTRNYVA